VQFIWVYPDNRACDARLSAWSRNGRRPTDKGRKLKKQRI
jgi:hypothetical protein